MFTTSKTRNKMMALVIAASMTAGVGSLTFGVSPAAAKGKKVSKSSKNSKSKKASAKNNQSNSIRQNNNQSQNANVKGGDGGDSGKVTCVSVLNGNTVSPNILSILWGQDSYKDYPPPGGTNSGNQCSSGEGGAGGGNDNEIEQEQEAVNVVDGDQENDGGAGMNQ
jgi:hypothetical protein